MFSMWALNCNFVLLFVCIQELSLKAPKPNFDWNEMNQSCSSNCVTWNRANKVNKKKHVSSKFFEFSH